jgi:hypothetical protein
LRSTGWKINNTTEARKRILCVEQGFALAFQGQSWLP